MTGNEKNRVYVDIPTGTPDVDGSVIGLKGTLEYDNEKVPYFERVPFNGNSGLKKSIVKINVPGSLRGQMGDISGNPAYRIIPVVKSKQRTEIEEIIKNRIQKERGRSIEVKVEFWN